MRAVVELSGRDSVVAFLKTIEKLNATGEKGEFIFSVAFVPSETDPDPDHNIFVLGEILKAHAERFLIGHKVLDLVYCAETGAWFDAVKHVFGTGKQICTPCIACHAYCHIARIHDCDAYDTDIIITGERTCHDGKFKPNQIPEVLEFFDEYFDTNHGIEFVRPVENMSDAEIAECYEAFCKEYNLDPNLYKFPMCSLSGNIKISEKASKENIVAYIRDEYLPLLSEQMTGIYDAYDKASKEAKSNLEED